MKNLSPVFLIIASFLWIPAIVWGQESVLFHSTQEGKSAYFPYTDKGDILPDFSYCGYKMGEEAIPNIAVVASCSPSETDNDTPFIQQVIDSLAQTKPDKNGFRGTILLTKGIYRIASPIQITASGIILRGEGNCKENGTLLLGTSANKYNLIEIGTQGHRTINGQIQEIYDGYVPSGTSVVHVENAEKHFTAGDEVVIHRPSTRQWIRSIGMDSIVPRPLSGETPAQAFERFRREGASTEMNGTVQWLPGSKDLLFERTIVAVAGDRITLDIPLTNALQKEFGSGQIYKFHCTERISNCGVENLYGMTLYDESIVEKDRFIGEYPADENHAHCFIECLAVENAWVRDVHVEHFDICVSLSVMAKFVTGQDLSAVNPVSRSTGGRRYAYSINGQLNLFQRCYGHSHRHTFVLGASVAGPNAFVDCLSENTLASCEPHQRWATGCLFDNITLTGPNPSLLAANRGYMGSGHGWSGAQMIFWNCSAPLILVMRPPTGQNFAIGFRHYEECRNQPDKASLALRSINQVSMSNYVYEGEPVVGDGWIESSKFPVTPESLYYQQLYNRVGKCKADAILTPTPYERFIQD